MIRTDFGGRSFDFVNDETIEEYQDTIQKLFALWRNGDSTPSEPSVVAEVIWEAVTDGTEKLRYRAGADAVKLLGKRKALDDDTFIGDMKRQMAF